MELAWLRSFCVLAETLHFGRAAVQLHLSQSALSVQIKRLEQSIQAQLFVRDRRTVILTRAGQSLKQDAEKLLREIAAAQRNARRAQSGEAGYLRVAFVNAATFGFLPRVIRHYKLHFPGVEIHLRNLPTMEQVGALLRKEIDIGFLRLPLETKELSIEPVHQEAFVCFLPNAHPLTQMEAIPPECLRGEPFILYERRQAPGFCDRILKICLDSGFSPNAVQEASEMQTILSLIAAGIGISLLPLSAGSLGPTGLSIRPLAGQWPPSEMGTAVLRSTKADPLLANFLRVAHDLRMIRDDGSSSAEAL